MKLKTIENIIDSIDVLNVAKNIGLKLEEKPISKNSAQTYLASKLYNEDLKLTNTYFLNLDIYKSNTPNFITGSGIDLLAAFYKGDYSKAFNAFFKLYGTSLKSKLIHDPNFIKGIITNTFIKRHSLIQHIITCLFSNTFNNHIHAKTWLSKHNIEPDFVRGFMFSLSTKDLKKLLLFIYNQEFIDYNSITDEQVDDFNVKSIVSELDFKGFNKEWIIIPFFSNYYSLSFLKIINPLTKEVCYAYLDDAKVAYAGLYSLNKFVDFNEKIRVLEDTTETAVLISNAKKLLNTNKQYLTVGINANSVVNGNLILNKPIFLYKENSNYELMKLLNITLPNFYICDFNNFTESNVVYKWEDFIFREFKKLAQQDKYLSPRVKTFIDVIDFSQFTIKVHIANWLKAKGLLDIYKAFNSISNAVYQFKNYSISSTADGYLALNKQTNETTIISNFILRLTSCIIFKGREDMIVKGVLVMGDNEYPLSFSKKALAKKDAIENIALKAFTNFNTVDSVYNIQESNIVSNKLPIVIDKSYDSALKTIINNTLSTVPCLIGQENKGWDKINRLFATPAWKASTTGLQIKEQYFYYDTLADNLYKPSLIKMSAYAQGSMTFLNKEIKDMLSYLLSCLYRTYFSYEVQPMLVYDSKTSRNLLRFIFAALAQREIFEYDVNERLIKNRKVFTNFNNYPILLRSNNPEQLLKLKSYPYILLCNDLAYNDKPYNIIFDLRVDEYPKVTKFALDTLERFFKWLFSNKIEEFELEKPLVEDYKQLIEEGNQIFDYLWPSEILNACKKQVNSLDTLKLFMSSVTSVKLESILRDRPDENLYGIRLATVATLPPETRRKWSDLKIASIEDGYAECPSIAPYFGHWCLFKKEFFDKGIEDYICADNKFIDKTNIKIHFDATIESEKIKPTEKCSGNISYTNFNKADIL